MATNYTVPEAYNKYLEQMQNALLSKTETMEYNPASPSALKSAIAKAIRPDYDKAIQSQQKAAAKNRAAIDADAAARGMGSSSWVTDVKNRQNDAAAANIAEIEGDYMSTLYGTLLDRLGQQEANKLSVDQFNATARQNALAQALSQTDKWWQTWEAQQKKKGGSGKPPTGDTTINTLELARLMNSASTGAEAKNIMDTAFASGIVTGSTGLKGEKAAFQYIIDEKTKAAAVPYNQQKIKQNR